MQTFREILPVLAAKQFVEPTPLLSWQPHHFRGYHRWKRFHKSLSYRLLIVAVDFFEKRISN
jgi:hypothetical protein